MTNFFARSKRQMLKSIHAWIGIVAGSVLSVVALTGSVIVFRAEIERAAIPKSASVDSSRQIDLDEAAREVARFRPDSRIRRVRLPEEPGAPYIFQVESSGKKTERIVSDSSSGRILGTIKPGWVEWTVDLHRNLLSGKPGRATVGAFGVVLFLLSATGLLMWMTGARNWRAWITAPRQGSTLRFNFELHRISGLWAYCFLAVISFTGIGLAYPETFRQAVQSLTGTPATLRAPKGIKEESLLSFDEYLRIGRSAIADGVATELRLPEQGKGPVDLRLSRSGDLAAGGNHVYLNPATAAVISIDRVADRPVGARFLAALSPIHYGEFGGIAIKIAWALLGLTPVLLFVTGLIAWWRPAKRPAKGKSSRPEFEEAGSEAPVLARR
jgi:uncharacterized iron-regulated membrane protein